MDIPQAADNFGRRLNWVVERVCAMLAAVMVMVIWYGVVERYFLKLGATWPEEFSRYVMIWLALLAVSCGAYRREHIGLDFILRTLSPPAKRWLRLALDLMGLVIFAFFSMGCGITRMESTGCTDR